MTCPNIDRRIYCSSAKKKFGNYTSQQKEDFIPITVQRQFNSMRKLSIVQSK